MHRNPVGRASGFDFRACGAHRYKGIGDAEFSPPMPWLSPRRKATRHFCPVCTDPLSQGARLKLSAARSNMLTV